MYKRILVPIDGSRTATLGLDEAIRIAGCSGAALRLVHVLDAHIVAPALSAGRHTIGIQDALRQDGRKMLDKAAARARNRGITVDTVMPELVGGRAAEAIVAQARKWRADLIVLGTHGRRGISRLFMGSDAEQVARMATAPVLLVRTQRSAA